MEYLHTVLQHLSPAYNDKLYRYDKLKRSLEFINYCM